jgi:hypothetical protein
LFDWLISKTSSPLKLLGQMNVAMFVNGSGQNEQFYRGLAIDAPYQVSVHLATRF